VRQINGCLLTIDDLGHLSRYVADLVLNQNITAGHDLYPTRSITTDLLFGGRYALLRREFQTPPEQGSSQTSDSKNILVMMGGSDPHNTAAKVAHALFHVPGIHARIIAGALNPHLPTLHQLAAESQGKIEVLVNVQDMVAQMDWANLAVSAGGTSVLELASRQVPTLLLSIADNQRAISAALHEHHVMTHLGWYESTDESTITEAIKEHLLGPLSTRKKQEDTRKRCKELCDGQGAARVVRHMTELDSQSQHREISFWPASMEDRTLV
jgi:spore coat polysaccharide biosynthesis predicted glycosyltransferase SpsG